MMRWMPLVLLGACEKEVDAEDPPWTSEPVPAPTTPMPTPPLPVPRLAIQVAGIWDADGPRGASTIIVEGEQIVEVLGGWILPPDAELVGEQDFWVMPGLVDPHVHLFLHGTVDPVGDALAANLRSLLFWGVTTAVDAGGPLETVPVRDRIGLAALAGPQLRVLGPFVTAEGSHPCETYDDPQTCLYADNSSTAFTLGAVLAAAGTDGVKVVLADASFTPWPTPMLATDAAAGAIDGHGGLSFAHVDEEGDALAALDAGVEVLAHVPFAEPLSGGAVSRISTDARAVLTTVGAFSGTDAVLAGGLLPADAGPLLAQTLTVWRALEGRADLFDPAWIAGNAAWADAARTNIALLHAAGANVIPASDGGYLYVPMGWGLHREWQELRVLGWTNTEILTASTVGAAEAIGFFDRGRIAAGQRADLLIVGSDPSEDVTVVGGPLRVIAGGVVYPRDALLTLDLRLQALALSDEGEFCLDERDCVSGGCDGLSHTCAALCPTAYAFQDPCGESAFCASADGDLASPVCRLVDDPCDPLDPAGTCGPSSYGENCYPVDLDTFGCGVAGPRAPGESCVPGDPEAACAVGAFCSAIDARCYSFCEVTAPDCSPGTSCVMQFVASEPWFALCLP